jgi:hypothetical protein
MVPATRHAGEKHLGSLRRVIVHHRDTETQRKKNSERFSLCLCVCVVNVLDLKFIDKDRQG